MYVKSVFTFVYIFEVIVYANNFNGMVYSLISVNKLGIVKVKETPSNVLLIMWC